MFGARVVLVIAGKSDGGLVVGVGERGGGLRDGPKDLGEKASQPKCLLHAVLRPVHRCHVLALRRGQGDDLLTFTRQRNGPAVNEECVPSDHPPVLCHGAIRVGISDERAPGLAI